MTNTETADQL